jgi:lipid-A-disaccharide synthase
VKVLVVAGEASADLHAGHVLERLRARGAKPSLYGIGGGRLEALGLRPLRTAREMAVVGFAEALRKVPQTLALLRELESLAAEKRPDFALLLDLPDFNLRLAPRLKRMGIPVVYYVSPQVWAWRPGRVRRMAECIDLLLAILPFEKGWYESHAPAKLRVEYVGHPAIEEIPELPYAPEDNLYALMPGSRESEWRALFPAMAGAAALLHRENPEARFLLPVAEPLRGGKIVRELLSLGGPAGSDLRALGTALEPVERPAHEVLRRAKAALIASGTATLEAAIVGVPMVVAYRVHPATAFLFRHLVRYRGPVAMVNLIHSGLGAEERVVPELLQDQVNQGELASALRRVATEPQWSLLRNRLARTRHLLSGAGRPIENAARAIEAFLAERAL